MTLLFFDGLDSATSGRKSGWANAFNGTTNGRDGSASGAAFLLNASTTFNMSSAAATFFCGFGYQHTSWSAANGTNQVLTIRTTGGTVGPVITHTSGGTLVARLGSTTGTVLGTASMNLSAQSAWDYIEVMCTLATAGGRLVVKLNGNTVIDFTGQTCSANGSVGSLVMFNGNGNQCYDDFYICDGVDATATQKRPNNTFIGDCKIARLLPTALGDVTQWAPSTGTSNFTLVDEAPPNTTDYVSSSTVGAQDLYQIADLPAGAATVYGAQLVVFASKSDTGNAFIKPMVKLGGTIDYDPTLGVSTTWVSYYGPFRWLKPDGTVWTPADVNAVQVGVEAA